MVTNTNWNQLREEHGIAYLRGDLATSSPESYTIEEMKEISEGMDASTAAVDAAIRSDFEQLPPNAQAMLPDLLEKADPENFDWWKETPLGTTPDCVFEAVK